MNMNCENISDLLPDLANGSLDATSAVRVRQHVASCQDCAAELSLIISLRVSPAVPVELTSRINAAVSARPVVSQGRWSGFGARQLTIAATIAVALIGGGVAVQQMERETGVITASPTGDSVASAPNTAVDAPVAEPVLGTGSVLSELNEKQLEALLAQMGS